MGQNNNSAKIYTSSLPEGQNVFLTDTKQIITAANNKAKSYEELALKYKNEAQKYRDEAKFYAEQNTNITMGDLLEVKDFLQEEIDTKQPVGEYALVSQLPENVSELNNDSEYATVTQLANLLPSQADCAGKFLKTDGENLEWMNIKGFSLFDTKLSDHILEGDEGFGWALQGTYTLSSYTDFYQKCLAEKNAGVETQTTLGENTITTYNNANGHIFYDIADKAVVDAFYNTYGACWMYGIDTENERIFLPRNDWFEQAACGSAGEFTEAQTKIPEHTHYMFTSGSQITNSDSSSNLLNSTQHVSSVKITGYSAYAMSPSSLETADMGVSGGVTSVPSVTTKPSSVKKLLYICVGNTIVNQANVDVANLTVDMQNKADTDADNFTLAGKEYLSGIGMPSNKYITLTMGASGTTYTAPANGWFTFFAIMSSEQQFLAMENETKLFESICWTPVGPNGAAVYLPAAKNDIVHISYSGTPTNERLKFFYAEGSKGE